MFKCRYWGPGSILAKIPQLGSLLAMIVTQMSWTLCPCFLSETSVIVFMEKVLDFSSSPFFKEENFCSSNILYMRTMCLGHTFFSLSSTPLSHFPPNLMSSSLHLCIYLNRLQTGITIHWGRCEHPILKGIFSLSWTLPMSFHCPWMPGLTQSCLSFLNSVTTDMWHYDWALSLVLLQFLKWKSICYVDPK